MCSTRPNTNPYTGTGYHSRHRPIEPPRLARDAPCALWVPCTQIARGVRARLRLAGDGGDQQRRPAVVARQVGGSASREQELAHQYFKAKNELLKAGRSFAPVHEPDGDAIMGGGTLTRAQKKAAAIAKAAAAKAAKEAKDG